MSTTKSDKHNNNVQSANDMETTKEVSATKKMADYIKAYYLSGAVDVFKAIAAKVDDYEFTEEEFTEWTKENAHFVGSNKNLLAEVRVFTQPTADDRETADKDERKTRIYSYATRDANGQVDDNLSGIWFTYWVEVASANEIKRSFDTWRRFKADQKAGADKAAKRVLNELLKDPTKRSDILAKLMEAAK